MKVALSSKPYAGPWGGGNRFVVALSQALTTAGHTVVHDLGSRDLDVIVPGDAISDTEIEATRAVLRSTERFHGFVTSTQDVLQGLTLLATGPSSSSLAPLTT